jgi:uracil-DNA glycosylase
MSPRTVHPGAEQWVPGSPTPANLAEAVQACRGCDLYRDATQAVMGSGNAGAALMLLGEQPGDREDVAGEPFVGPAGKVLDRALAEAGIDPDDTYVTNAVKHFKWEPRGKVRLHKTPNAAEVHACRPWLEAELRTLRPSVLVCLGATAAKALLGPSFKVSQERGRLVPSDLAPSVLATVHPSSILRTDGPEREAAMAAFVDDLQVAAAALAR